MAEAVQYRELEEDEMERGLFSEFRRHQVVTDCWCRINGTWVIQPDPFIDEWSGKDYVFLVQCLKNTVHTKGVVYGAFRQGVLKGFASVEPERFGNNMEYLNLSSIHISEEQRGMGIGKHLFLLAAAWAKNKGAEKLYISAHSAVESQAFYHALGCVEAETYRKEFVEKEPFDCQLEYRL